MLKMSKLLAGAIGAAAAIFGSTGAIADSKGSVSGDIRYGLDLSDSSGPVSDAADTGADTDLRDLNSYVGIKASTGQGDIRAFGVYESYVGADVSLLSLESSRQLFAGLSTGFGTVTYGRMFTEYAKSGIAIDPFYNTALASANGGVAGSTAALGVAPTFTSYGISPFFTGEAPYLGALGSGVQPSQLAYESPNIFGLTFNGAVFFDRNDDSSTNAGTGEESHDYGAGLAWNGMGITAGVQFLQVNDEVGAGTFLGASPALVGGTGDATATRLHASYAAQRFGAAVSVERADLQGAGVLDQDFYFASGWFGVMPGTRLAASVGMTNETGFEGTGMQLGVFHDVMENFTLHAGASMYDLHEDSVSGPGPAVDDSWIAALGASYKFELGFMSR